MRKILGLVKGWSTEEMKNKPGSSKDEDTEEMIGWRSTSQEETDECKKKFVEKVEEDVLKKNKVDDGKRGTY